MTRTALLVVVAVTAMAGCVTVDEEVRVLVAGDPEELAAYRSVVGAFHDSQDEVHIRLEEVADRDALIARLATSFAGGAPPDAFLLNYRYAGRFVATGAVRPLDDVCFPHYVLLEDDQVDACVGRFGAVMMKLVRQALWG